MWDYPIREQYGHILLAINSSNPVRDAAEGFRKVNEHENADFAFIHDTAEIKYEISRNCNLTEVGEPFAEQPYALGIQQGSYLQVLFTDWINKKYFFLQDPIVLGRTKPSNFKPAEGTFFRNSFR